MPSNYENTRAFLTADEIVAIDTLQTMANLQVLGVSRYHPASRFQRLYLYVKGNHASCSKMLDFYFQVSPDGINWHDLPVISVGLSGANVITDKDTCVPLDLADVNYIRLARVKNNETATGYTATVNAYLSAKLN